MNKALIVGINDYPKYPLYDSINDAKSLAGILRNHGNEAKESNFEVELRTKITKKINLKKAIIKLFETECETVLFYFSGHGKIDQFGEGHIVTPDFKQYDEGISMDDLLLIANFSKAKNKIIILDCCYSGAMGSPAMSCGRSLLQEGMIILTASRKNEKAKEGKGHGSYTRLLIEALEGGAADIEGKISPGGVYSFIDKAMGEDEQRPTFKANVSRFVLLRKVNRHVPLDVLKNLEKYFKGPDDEHELKPSYEYTNDPKHEIKPKKPYAIEEKTIIFKELQLLTRAGLIVPVDEEHMYFAAMNSKACKLTAVGQYYWHLAKEDKLK